MPRHVNATPGVARDIHERPVRARHPASFVADEIRASLLYSVTTTGVPSGALSKNGLAIPLGKRMHPCDAAYGGT